MAQNDKIIAHLPDTEMVIDYPMAFLARTGYDEWMWFCIEGNQINRYVDESFDSVKDAKAFMMAEYDDEAIRGNPVVFETYHNIEVS